MEFRTKATVDNPCRGLIAHGDGIVTLGSCFSDNIARRLSDDLFSVTANPTGTLYNPISIADAVERIASGHPFNRSDLLIGPDRRWHSMSHHSSFSGNDPDTVLAGINSSLETGHKALTSAKIVFITLGSAWVYTMDSVIVANCHKFPASRFNRRRLSVDEVTDSLLKIAATLPKATIIITISPVRHLADGLHGNNLSKATLLLGAENSGLPYFPAYEAVIDDLRDYRFYNRDMKHPSDIAADYVYDLLTDSFMTAETKAMLPACRSLTSMAKHRPLGNDTAAQLRDSILKRAAALASAYPVIAPAIKQFLNDNGLLNQ